jgi:hypothetical protein
VKYIINFKILNMQNRSKINSFFAPPNTSFI